jgi:autoinducer 2-degrading protein
VLSVSVSLRIREGRAADFLAALGQARSSALADEPGCLQFDIGRDVDDPEVFHLYEVYRDEAALAEHRAAPHFDRWRQASGDLLAEGGRTTRLSELVASGHDEPTEVSP